MVVEAGVVVVGVVVVIIMVKGMEVATLVVVGVQTVGKSTSMAVIRVINVVCLCMPYAVRMCKVSCTTGANYVFRSMENQAPQTLLQTTKNFN